MWTKLALGALKEPVSRHLMEAGIIKRHASSMRGDKIQKTLLILGAMYYGVLPFILVSLLGDGSHVCYGSLDTLH